MTMVQIRGDTQIVAGSITDAQVDLATVNLFSLYLRGRDPIEHREEYMEEIHKLTFVTDNFIKVRVYQQIKRLFKKC